MTNKLLLALFALFVGFSGCKKDSPTETPPPDQTPDLLGAPNNSMVRVTGGAFLMGSDTQDYPYAHPQHAVTLTTFNIDNYEILYEKWVIVNKWGATHGYTDIQEFGANGFDAGPNAMQPVAQVNWYDAVKWCNARSEMDGLTPVYYTGTSHIPAKIYRTGTIGISNDMVNWTANGYRLPTEAEWEFAARGGTKAQVPTPYMYSGSNFVDSVAWYSGNAGATTHAREYKKPNELGIYDMSGNVNEWCWDWYLFYYQNGVQTDPKGVTSGEERVIRGGSYFEGQTRCRSLDRFFWSPAGRINNSGFRCVRVTP